MTAIVETKPQEIQKPKVVIQGGGSDSVYGLGFIGAMVYYMGRAHNFQEGAVGFFKAMVWPAILVYEIFKLLKIGERVEEPESQEPSI